MSTTHHLAVVAALAAAIVGGNAHAATVTAPLEGVGPAGVIMATQSWIEVTDRPSRITVTLPGQATPQDVSGFFGGKNVNGRYYAVRSGNNIVSATVLDTPGNQIDLDRALRSAWAAATVVDTQKTTVDGHPALDAAIEVATDAPTTVVLVRLIATDTHVLELRTQGPAADEKILRHLHQWLLAGVHIP